MQLSCTDCGSYTSRMDFLECKVCHVPYDEEEHRPRNAPCGHELCTACISALIKDSIFECPKCRQKSKVEVPGDMPVSYGLIDVIRAFSTQSIPMSRETESRASGSAIDEMCTVHSKALTHWCFKCQIWICQECLESHTTIIDCSTTTSDKAMEDMKETNSKNIGMVISLFEENTKYMSYRIGELNDKRKEISDKRRELMEMDEKCGEELKNIGNSLEQGNMHKEKLLEAKKLVDSASSQHSLCERIKVATQRKKILHSWSVKSLGMDTPYGLLKALEEGKTVYAKMVLKDEKRNAKLTQHEEKIHLHTFLKQAVSDNSICMSFDQLQKMISMDASLVFIELSLGGSVKGRVYIRLDKELPNIRKNFIHIVTGQKGPTVAGIKFGAKDSNVIEAGSLPFSELRFTRDSIDKTKAKRGDILGYINNGYLQDLAFFSAAPPKTFDYESDWSVFGHMEAGMDVVLECYDELRSGVTVSDSGLVLEK
ncbi:unnamed protein product [Meganyctiphanes norvegica]|uniref:RING-type domain-containing protein n=1 Tax=Meganyctiphanes norvegica TaxID=48144 RepID=A0AAV2SD80_MEGNR